MVALTYKNVKREEAMMEKENKRDVMIVVAVAAMLAPIIFAILIFSYPLIKK